MTKNTHTPPARTVHPLAVALVRLHARLVKEDKTGLFTKKAHGLLIGIDAVKWSRWTNGTTDPTGDGRAKLMEHLRQHNALPKGFK